MRLLQRTARRVPAQLRPPQTRSASSASLGDRPFTVAIVGSGPAGLYAASRLLGTPGSSKTRVDVFEALPVPFGLSRFGVAPDHPEVKNCEHTFEKAAKDPRFRFFGNVQVTGQLDEAASAVDASSHSLSPNVSPSLHAHELPLSHLRSAYDAVLLSYGATLDRLLDVPGEATTLNVLSARAFVNWYNGHPHATPLSSLIDLSTIEHVSVIGQGNVALDVARMLLKSVDDLSKTDMPEYALAQLARSQVKRVDVIGRRGPLQLAATNKELRELMALPGVAFDVDKPLVDGATAALEASAAKRAHRAKTRALKLLADGSRTRLPDATRSWSLQFLHSPSAFVSRNQSHDPLSPSPLRAIEYDLNELELADQADPTRASARRSGKSVAQSTDMAFKSVGYRSIGLPGLPFDERRAVIKNDEGRVVDDAGKQIPGLYTAGWLARGPTGVIATTMFDAFATAETIAHDLGASYNDARPGIDLKARATAKPVVSWADWERIDSVERARGAEAGKPRVKITDIESLLAFVQ